MRTPQEKRPRRSEHVSRLFVEALADRSAGRLRIGAIAGATALVLAVTVGVAVWPALGSSSRAPASPPAAAGRASGVQPFPPGAAPGAQATPAPGGPVAAAGGGQPAARGAPVAAGPTPAFAPPGASQGAPPPPASVAMALAAPAARFSFEDGGTDGWGGHGHVTSLGSGTVAHDGARSLRVGLVSTGNSDLPIVSVSVSGSSAPGPGQTLTAFVLVQGGSVGVQGKLFVQDTGFGWHMSPLVTLAGGGWTRLTLKVPSGIAVSALGVQFLCSPANTGGVLFVDSVSWS
jgi:hypothetical protein